MKSVRLTINIKKQLVELRKSRNSIDEYYFNFLKNFYDSCKFIHFQIDKKIPKTLFAVGYRQYIAFLISIWETFFRDVFIFLCYKKKNLESKFIRKLKLKDTGNLSRIEKIELVSKCFNFQNLDDINSAFSIIFDNDFFDELSNYKIPYCGIKGEVAKDIQLKNIDKEWLKNIEKAFNIRHKIIHNANFRPEIDIKFIQKAEALFLLIPQIVCTKISIKYHLKHTHLSNKQGGSYPAIFIVDDILSEKWEIAFE